MQTINKNWRCLKCKLLPICLGSCPLTVEKRCHRLKQHPESLVLKLADQIIGAVSPL